MAVAGGQGCGPDSPLPGWDTLDAATGYGGFVCYHDGRLSFATATVVSLIGLVALTLGADWLVRGASRLAAQFGISPLAVGLTVVAYGTSAPEIVASVVAAATGYPEMTVGNVLGSNVANLGLILGAAAIFTPLAIAPTVLRRALPFMVGVTLLLGSSRFASRSDGGSASSSSVSSSCSTSCRCAGRAPTPTAHPRRRREKTVSRVARC